MLNFRGRWPRIVRSGGLLGLSLLGAGCLNEPLPDYRYQSLDAAGEVFRVFCKRVARDAYPADPSGDSLMAKCDGAPGAKPDKEPNAMLRTLILRRPQIVTQALEQLFGKRAVEGSQTFADNELGDFLSSLVPLYDLPAELVPNATRNIAALFGKLTDPNDPRASAVMDTIARLSVRVGYRPPELVLGAIRPILAYDRLDQLADVLLQVLSKDGSAHEQWLGVLRAAALELADEPVKAADPQDTTLRVALDLLLKTDDKLAGTSGPLPVLQRDDHGDAKLSAGMSSTDLPTPFAMLDRDDQGQARDGDTLALQGGKPMYDTLDANKTILAATLRETSTLIDRGTEERSSVENLAHGLKPLLGPWGERSFKIGQNDYAFQGPDVAKAPLLEFVHALAVAARYPETQALLEVLRQLLSTNESEATAAVYGALKINERSKDHPDAKLNGPHEFWDDLIDAGNQVLARDGLLEALIRSFTEDVAAQQGPIFADWMTHNDVVTYQNAPIVINPPGPYTELQKKDINAPVTQPLTMLVDREKPDTGMNRSIWQRTMSMIAGLNGVKVCNKKGATLNVPTDLGEFNFPVGRDGYDECELITFNDALEVYGKAMLGTATVVIHDDIAGALDDLGATLTVVGTIPEVTEKESQLKGFSDTLSPQSLARFLFAPRNKFISDLFEPLQTHDKVAINLYEPYALFPMEDPNPDADGQSFLTAGVPLLKAFDGHELRDKDGKLPKGYMFGNLLSMFHKHWSSKQEGPCSVTVMKDGEGCVQSGDPGAPFYSPGTNLVSYERLLGEAFKEEDYIGILHRAAVKLAQLKSPDGSQDGVQVLAGFVKMLLTPDPALRTRSGADHSKTNTCVETVGMDGMPACQDGVGRIIKPLTPLYMLLDALKTFDNTFAAPDNKDRLDVWHAGRSKLVDQLLTVDRSGAADAYTYKLADRNAYAIAVAALPWVSDQIKAHTAAGDIVDWSDGLSGRLGKIIAHPLTAGVLDLLDAFWSETEASGEFTKVSAAVLDEANNQAAYRGMLVSATDLLTLLHTDQNLSPAIQFAALALAPNAFDAVQSSALPEVEGSPASTGVLATRGGALSAGLEFTRTVVKNLRSKQTKSDAPTALAKLLHNAVLSDGTARSPAEILFDAVADVNRKQTDAPTEQTLDADEDRQVFGNIQSFLHDDDDEQRSLERLYHVIQARTLDGTAK